MSSTVRALGYIRCSTVDQAVDGLSLEAQRSRIAAWCEASGSNLVDVIEDAGVSGSRRLADRPGGRRLVEQLDARHPGIDTVVILRLDRLGRNAAETLALLRRFTSGSVGLVSISDRVDLSTPQGRATAQLGAVFAELERALIGQRTAEALRTLRAEGRVYGPTPFGYRRNGGLLELHDEEQRVLRRVRASRGRGHSYARIAEALNERGVPAKQGGRWHAMSVRSVLLTSGGQAVSGG